MKGRLRVNLRGWVFLVLAVAVGIAAVVKGNNLLFLVFSTLAAVFVSSILLTWLTARRIEIARLVPDTCFAGEPFPVTLRVRNAKRFFPAFAIRIEDRLSHEGRPAQLQPPPVYLPHATPREKVRGTYSIVALHRGKAKLGPLQISAEFPPGLATWRAEIPTEDDLLIFPRRAVLRGRVVNPYLSRVDTCEYSSVLTPGGDDEFAGLREYREGESLRHVHWKMSARVPGRLLVREFEDIRIRNAVVLLDTYVPNLNDARRRLRLERAICFAGALVDALHAESYTVKFMGYVPELVEIPLEPRPGSILDLYATLAVLKPSKTRTLGELLALQQGLRDEIYFVLRIGDEGLPHWAGAGRAVLLDANHMRSVLEYEAEP